MSKQNSSHSVMVSYNGKEYNLILQNPWGFDHSKVKETNYGSPEYIATLPYNDSFWAFYYVEKPDLDKGHKNIMMLGCGEGIVYVSGMPFDKYMEEYNSQKGKLCEKCNEIIYSAYRHDYRKCSCKNVMVDGGSDYFRSSIEGVTVVIDFFNKSISQNED